jgi:hypothetical protein
MNVFYMHDEFRVKLCDVFISIIFFPTKNISQLAPSPISPLSGMFFVRDAELVSDPVKHASKVLSTSSSKSGE